MVRVWTIRRRSRLAEDQSAFPVRILPDVSMIWFSKNHAEEKFLLLLIASTADSLLNLWIS